MESRKQDIIIELGTEFLRVGLVSDRTPRKTFPSQSPLSLACFPMEMSAYQFQLSLEEILYSIFYTHINASSLNKTVVLLEHVYTDRRIVECIAKILFKKFKIEKLEFSLSCITPLYLTGKINGIVISGGASCVQIMAIYESYPLMRQFKYVPTGTHAMTKLIKDQLLLLNPEVPGDIFQKLTEEQLCEYRNLYSNMTLIQSHSYSKSQQQPQEPPVVSVTFKKTKLKLKPTAISYSNLYGDPEKEEHNIAYLLLTLLEQLLHMDKNMFEAVVGNIVLAGGLWRIKGMNMFFKRRLKDFLAGDKFTKLNKFGIQDKIKFLNWKFNPSEVSWIGASVGASVKAVDSLCLKKSEYEAEGFTQKIMSNYFLSN